jgi:hypothetical protein
MILVMKNIEKNNVINFSIEDNNDYDSMSDDDLTYQARVTLTAMLNRVAAGQHILTEKDKSQIRFFNKTVTKYGHSPIDCDLDDL